MKQKSLGNKCSSEVIVDSSTSFVSWSDYSKNYIVAISTNGHRVSASKSAAEFSAKFEKYNKKHLTKNSS